MGQVLHESARTTAAIRRAKQPAGARQALRHQSEGRRQVEAAGLDSSKVVRPDWDIAARAWAYVSKIRRQVLQHVTYRSSILAR
jgi:hypothetical protein